MKLQPGASSSGAKQYGYQWTNQRMDVVSYRGAMLTPKKLLNHHLLIWKLRLIVMNDDR